MREEVVGYSSDSARTVTNVRCTLLASSLTTLRARGHYDRYLEELPSEHREAVLGTMGMGWVEIAAAEAHYGACDRLNLPEEELLAIGRAVGDKIQSTFLGTLGRRARDVGVAPWIILGQYQRLWDRLMQGGSVRVLKVGPKDALVTIRGLSLCRFAYFRHGFVGVNLAAGGLFARKMYGSMGTFAHSQDSMDIKLAWV